MTWTLPLDLIEQQHHDRIDPEMPQQPFTVECWHEGRPIPSWVCTVGYSPNIEARDAMLYAIRTMALTCAPDYIVFAYDTHMSMSPTNPTTGKPWESHEMQRMCDEEGYCETGVITDNLIASTLRMSDGLVRMKCFPYHVEDGKVIYFDEAIKVLSEWEGEGVEGQRMEGLIPDTLREIHAEYADPNGHANLIRSVGSELGMDAESVRIHTVMAGVKVLGQSARQHGEPGLFESMVLAASVEEAQIIAQSVAQPEPTTEESDAISSIVEAVKADRATD